MSNEWNNLSKINMISIHFMIFISIMSIQLNFTPNNTCNFVVGPNITQIPALIFTFRDGG